ncbi:hypothetical protein DZF96_17985, partial [Clavibacter michiganensis]
PRRRAAPRRAGPRAGRAARSRPRGARRPCVVVGPRGGRGSWDHHPRRGCVLSGRHRIPSRGRPPRHPPPDTGLAVAVRARDPVRMDPHERRAALRRRTATAIGAVLL